MKVIPYMNITKYSNVYIIIPSMICFARRDVGLSYGPLSS